MNSICEVYEHIWAPTATDNEDRATFQNKLFPRALSLNKLVVATRASTKMSTAQRMPGEWPTDQSSPSAEVIGGGNLGLEILSCPRSPL